MACVILYAIFLDANLGMEKCVYDTNNRVVITNFSDLCGLVHESRAK